MSFFGFDTALPTALEGERHRAGKSNGHNLGAHPSRGDKDLSDTLVESLDELNDETFGGGGGGDGFNGDDIGKYMIATRQKPHCLRAC
mgnify:CR=1 FL=1